MPPCPFPCPPAAVATGIACGVPLKAVVAGIEAVDIIPGRCEIVDEGQQFSVVVSWLDSYPNLFDSVCAAIGLADADAERGHSSCAVGVSAAPG